MDRRRSVQSLHLLTCGSLSAAERVVVSARGACLASSVAGESVCIQVCNMYICHYVYRIPYSAKFSRSMIFTVFADWAL